MGGLNKSIRCSIFNTADNSWFTFYIDELVLWQTLAGDWIHTILRNELLDESFFKNMVRHGWQYRVFWNLVTDCIRQIMHFYFKKFHKTNLWKFGKECWMQTKWPTSHWMCIHSLLKISQNSISNPHMTIHFPLLNPPTTTTRVKISQNFDILPKTYLLHLKFQHCQTLRVVRTFTGQMSRSFLTGKSIVWYCSGWSKWQ